MIRRMRTAAAILAGALAAQLAGAAVARAGVPPGSPPPLVFRLEWVEVGTVAGGAELQELRRMGPSALLGGGTWIFSPELLPRLQELLQQARLPDRVAPRTVLAEADQAAAGALTAVLGEPVRLRMAIRPIPRPGGVEGAVREASLTVTLRALSVDGPEVEAQVEVEAAGPGSVMRYLHTLRLTESGAPVAVLVDESGRSAFALTVAARVDRPPSAPAAVPLAAVDAFEARFFQLMGAMPARRPAPLAAAVVVESELAPGTGARWQLGLRQPAGPGLAVEGAVRWQPGSATQDPEGTADVRVALRARLLYELDLLAGAGATGTLSAGPTAWAAGIGVSETTHPSPGLSLTARVWPLVWVAARPAGVWERAPASWRAEARWEGAKWGLQAGAGSEWPDPPSVSLVASLRPAPWLELGAGLRYALKTGSNTVLLRIAARPGSPARPEQE